jgi:hypothetical protein
MKRHNRRSPHSKSLNAVEKTANASSHTGIKALARNARPKDALSGRRSWEA